MIKKILISFLFACAALGLKAQQQSQYSTYMFNHFVINPAYAGSKQTMYVNTVQRYQWLGTKGGPRVQTVNIQYPTKRRKVGLGFSIVNDQIGPNRNMYGLFTYAYHLKLPQGKLSMGVRAGAYSFYQDIQKITYQDGSDPLAQQSYIRKVVPTGDFGVYYYARDYYVSLSLNQLWGGKLTSVQGAADYSKLTPHIFFSAGKAFVYHKKFIFNPSVLVKQASGAPIAVDLNCNMRVMDKLWVGASYRLKNGIVLITQFNITEKLRFGYGYDWGLNKFGTVAGATHEFYLGYDFNIHNNKIVSTRFL